MNSKVIKGRGRGEMCIVTGPRMLVINKSNGVYSKVKVRC